MWNKGIYIVIFSSFCFAVHSPLPLNNFLSRFCQRKNENGTRIHNDLNSTIAKFKYVENQHKTTDGNYCNNDSKQVQNKKLPSNNVSSYEQLVIIKKYPYLDLNEIHRGNRPLNHKNSRQRINVEAPENVEVESDVRRDPIEDILLNVEIINRGLSGFAVPTRHPEEIKEIPAKCNGKKSPIDAKSMVIAAMEVPTYVTCKKIKCLTKSRGTFYPWKQILKSKGRLLTRIQY